MISYREALNEILALDFKAKTEELDLMQAQGRILAHSLEAPWPLPRFDNSSMDGIAVRAEDTKEAKAESPVTLRLRGESAAGHGFYETLQPGEAVRISTGAPIPQGADAVIPIERVEIEGDEVKITEAFPVKTFIREQGTDVPGGARLFESGMRITPARLMVLASYNIERVQVYRRPKVALLTSGDEIKEYGQPLGPNDIVGSSLYYLEEELEACGCEACIFGIASDEVESFEKLLEEALAWGDFIVSTAGVSVGEHDIVGKVLERFGAETIFWRVAVRPGKPMLLARLKGVPYFGLPGNPVSTCCNNEIFLKPFLRQAFGKDEVEAPFEKAVLMEDCPRDRKRLFFIYSHRRLEDGTWKIRPFRNQSSGNLANPAYANCLIVAEPGVEPLFMGSTVDCLPIRQGL